MSYYSVMNPYTYADLSQPQRRRVGPSPVVMQTGPERLVTPELDETFTRLSRGSHLLGSYAHVDEDVDGLGEVDLLPIGTKVSATLIPHSVPGGDAPLARLRAALTQAGYRVDRLGWERGGTVGLAVTMTTGKGSVPVREELRAKARGLPGYFEIPTIRWTLPRTASDRGSAAETATEVARTSRSVIDILFGRERPQETAPPTGPGTELPPEAAPEPFFSRTVMGMPVWLLSGLVVVGGGAAVVMAIRRGKQARAMAPNRHRGRR